MAVTYEPIASTTLGSAASSVTFSSIAATWTDLRIVFEGASDSGYQSVKLRFNGDTGNNFSSTRIYGSGSSAVSTRASNESSIAFGGIMDGGRSVSIFEVMSYANTNVFKTVLSNGAAPSNSTNAVTRAVGLWRSTSAITSIEVATFNTAKFVGGSTFSLYGIKAA